MESAGSSSSKDYTTKKRAREGEHTPTNMSKSQDKRRRNSKGEAMDTGNDDYATRGLILEMEDRLTTLFASRLDTIENHVVENTNQIKELKADVEAREEQLERRLNRRLDAKNKEIEDKLARAITLVAATGSGHSLRTEKQEEAYDHHRKTLRMWPIKGQGSELVKATKSFFQQKLKIIGTAYEQIGKIDIRRAKDSSDKFPDEIVVVFTSKEVRDTVKAAGKNLAGEKECGMRLNVPAFLLEDYRLLASVGYTIKTSQADVRRAIKFDDASRGLVLDIRIDNEWRRVTPQEAKEAAKTNPDIRAGPKKLDSAGISALLGGEKKSPATGANTVQID